MLHGRKQEYGFACEIYTGTIYSVDVFSVGIIREYAIIVPIYTLVQSTWLGFSEIEILFLCCEMCQYPTRREREEIDKRMYIYVKTNCSKYMYIYLAWIYGEDVWVEQESNCCLGIQLSDCRLACNVHAWLTGSGGYRELISLIDIRWYRPYEIDVGR